MKRLFLSGLLTAVLIFGVATVSAHQPWFEERDISAEFPWLIVDPSVSTALYSTLESSSDIDYYTFEIEEGGKIQLAITIPQIAGQEAFDPTMVLYGPGLPASGEEIPPVAATEFFEPFSRTSYWQRQERIMNAPASGRYTVAVSSGQGETGRYTFVIGYREVGGGDSAFSSKMEWYWTPFVAQLPVAEPTAVPQPTATAVPPTPVPPTVTPQPTQLPTATALPIPTEVPVSKPPQNTFNELEAYGINMDGLCPGE